MKTCFKCLKPQSLDDFYRHPEMKDGHLNKCKECTIRDSEKTNKRVMADPELLIKRRACNRDCQKKRYTKGLVKKYDNASQNNREYRLRNPEKYSAHIKVKNALRSNKILKAPCSVCGSEKSEAHHEDYSKPLEVIWLCRSHHGVLHRLAIDF